MGGLWKIFTFKMFILFSFFALRPRGPILSYARKDAKSTKGKPSERVSPWNPFPSTAQGSVTLGNPVHFLRCNKLGVTALFLLRAGGRCAQRNGISGCAVAYLPAGSSGCVADMSGVLGRHPKAFLHPFVAGQKDGPARPERKPKNIKCRRTAKPSTPSSVGYRRHLLPREKAFAPARPERRKKMLTCGARKRRSLLSPRSESGTARQRTAYTITRITSAGSNHMSIRRLFNPFWRWERFRL